MGGQLRATASPGAQLAGRGSFPGEAAGPGPGVAPGPGGKRVAMGKHAGSSLQAKEKKKSNNKLLNNPTLTKPHRHSSIKSVSANRRGRNTHGLGLALYLCNSLLL